MSLGVPNTPWLSYIPGKAVYSLLIEGQTQAFGYSPSLNALTFATLPSPAVAGQGARAWITDGTSRTFGANPTGGGSDIVPVWTDGTTWYIG